MNKQKIKDLEEIEKITSKSKITKQDVEELSKKIKSSAALRFNESCNR